MGYCVALIDVTKIWDIALTKYRILRYKNMGYCVAKIWDILECVALLLLFTKIANSPE